MTDDSPRLATDRRVHQAEGALSFRLGIDIDAAARALRQQARRTSTELLDVAKAVLSGELPLPGSAADVRIAHRR